MLIEACRPRNAENKLSYSEKTVMKVFQLAVGGMLKVFLYAKSTELSEASRYRPMQMTPV